MTSAHPLVPEYSWTHWYRRALPAYWIFLFCTTHFPGLYLNVGVRDPDKVAHTAAFGLLAFLFWRFAETLRRPLSGRFVWTAVFCLAVYAALDEYTQRYVGRGSNIRDWLFGMGGICTVLAILEWHRRRRARAVRI